MRGMCLPGARNDSDADSTSGDAATIDATVGQRDRLRGNGWPYACMMNIRQSRASLAEMSYCSRMIS